MSFMDLPSFKISLLKSFDINENTEIKKSKESAIVDPLPKGIPFLSDVENFIKSENSNIFHKTITPMATDFLIGKPPACCCWIINLSLSEISKSIFSKKPVCFIRLTTVEGSFKVQKITLLL